MTTANLYYYALALLLLCTLACQPAQQTLAEQHTPTAHFIVIGIDGMSPDGINNAPTPNLDWMMQNGAYTLTARAVLPTSSSTNWASMLMAAGPEQHGVTSNNWERDDYVLPPVVTGTEDIFPTIFDAIRKQLPTAETGAIYHWDGFGRLFEKSAVNYDKHIDSEQGTTDEAGRYILDKKPKFLFVHLDHVDGAGHGAGHGTPEYYQAVARADSLIGQIIQATKDAGIFEQTVFLVTSDHGGIGTGHGGETPDEILIPFILSGPGVKKGYKIPHPVYTYDNAATVAFALGIELPNACIGRPVKTAFEGYNLPDGETVVANEALATPVIYPKREGHKAAGGLFIDSVPEVRIETMEKDGITYYTLDGSEPTETSTKYEAPFPLSHTAVVKAKTYKNDVGSQSYIAYFRVADSKTKSGLKYSYYEGEGWMYLPSFKSFKPVRTGTAIEPSHDQVQGHREQTFAYVFQGFIKIDTLGEYRFYTNSDDGSKLFVGDELIVDNDGDHGTRERSGKTDLSPGWHPIRIEWFNGGGGYWLSCYYRGPGIPKQIIPADVLMPVKPL
jgi:hypothetical protein